VEDNYYPFVHIPSSQFDLDDFNLNYLDNTSTTNVNPQKAFQDAFENTSETGSSSSVSNMAHVTVNEPEVQVWNIPQLNTEEKTAHKITSWLAKAVNAALTIKSDKDAISKINKQYLRPENVILVCAPKCNKEIRNAVCNNAHSKDLALQDVQKCLTLGLTPIINMTDKIAKTKEPIDSDTGRTMLTDAISLIGHSFLLFSNKRRQSLRNYIHDRYNKKIVPLMFLLQINCLMITV